MYLRTLPEPGEHHHNRAKHLIFVIINGQSHGLDRIEPEMYQCECGATLSPTALDEGDESKASWPNCKSWRDGGKKKCYQCGEYPSIGRDQHIRARGYIPKPKDDIKSVTNTQREDALDAYDNTCGVCGKDDPSYVKRIVPPRYQGNRELVNLLPLCENHHENYGHKFADLFYPPEWLWVRGITWREVAEDARNAYTDNEEFQPVVEKLDALLDDEHEENPYPYLGV